MWDAVAAEKEKRKGPVEPAAAAAPSAPSAPADEPAVAVSQEPSPIEAAGGEDAPKKRKRSRSEKVDWHALTLAALGEVRSPSLLFVLFLEFTHRTLRR